MTQKEIIMMAIEQAYSEMEKWDDLSLIGLTGTQIEFALFNYRNARKRYIELKEILYGWKEIENEDDQRNDV